MARETRFFRRSEGDLQRNVREIPPLIALAVNGITIPPGGDVDVGYSIDRSLRPDASSPFGSVHGEIGLEYESSADVVESKSHDDVTRQP